MSAELELIETRYGPLYSLKHDYITWGLRDYGYGAQQRGALAMLLSMLKPGDCVVDVGAHIGLFSIPFATKVGDTGHVYAFEALVDNYRLLEKNVAVNLARGIITTYCAIVTDRPGNFLAQLSDTNTGETFFERHEGDSNVDTRCVILDEWWEQTSSEALGSSKIDLIKVDVEGMDLEVLRGCQRILSKYKPILYVEVDRSHLDRFGVDASQLDSFLRSFGYRYFRNIGEPTSPTDEFKIVRLYKLETGGSHFDVLAVHPNSGSYLASFWGALHATIQTWLNLSLLVMTRTSKRCSRWRRSARRLQSLLIRYRRRPPI